MVATAILAWFTICFSRYDTWNCKPISMFDLQGILSPIIKWIMDNEENKENVIFIQKGWMVPISINSFTKIVTPLTSSPNLHRSRAHSHSHNKNLPAMQFKSSSIVHCLWKHRYIYTYTMIQLSDPRRPNLAYQWSTCTDKLDK